MKCPSCGIRGLVIVEDVSNFGPGPVPEAVLQKHPLPWQYCTHCGRVFTDDALCHRIGRMNDQDDVWEWAN